MHQDYDNPTRRKIVARAETNEFHPTPRLTEGHVIKLEREIINNSVNMCSRRRIDD